MTKTALCLAGLTLILHLATICNGQMPSNLDSLEQVLTTQPEDTSRIKTLIYLIEAFKQSDKEKAISYADQLYQLSFNLNYTPGIIDAFIQKSAILINLGNYDSASTLCKKVNDLCFITNDSLRMAQNYRTQAIMMYYIESPSKAFEYFKKSLLICERIKDSLGIAGSLNGLALSMYFQSKYDSAILYYIELFKICEEKNYLEILAKGYLNIGSAYNELRENDKAVLYYQKCIQICEKNNYIVLLGKAYNNLANILYDQKEYDNAWLLFNKAVELSKSTGYDLGLPHSYNNMGNIKLEWGEYEDAFNYYELAKKYYNELQDREGYIKALKNQGLIYQEQGKYDQALEIFFTCAKLSQEIGASYLNMETRLNIYRTYREMGDYRKAFDNVLIYQFVRDSVLNIEKSKAIAEYELKYEKEKYLATNLALRNSNLEKDLDIKKRTIQRNIYLFGGSGSILLLLFIIAFYIQRTRKNRIIAQQRIHQLEEEKKLLAARSIVLGQEEERKRIATELHDGLGVLLSSAKMQFTTLRDKTPENKPLIERASKLLEQATTDVRRISHNMMPGLLTKFGFFEAVQDLLEQLDDAGKLKTKVVINGETRRFQENTEIMLYRIIQEMVNNTIKHAEAQNIELNLVIAPGLLIVKYTDDGKGFTIRDKMDSKSIGLTSIQSRVKFLNGELHFESQPGKGVLYSFEIPINKQGGL